MNTTSRQLIGATALAFSISPLLIAPAAAADTAPRKAAIEHQERQGGSAHAPKAQIERQERFGNEGSSEQQRGPATPSSGGGGGASSWQLALSAALGLGLVGGGAVAVRQVSHHRPLSSAH